jgi:hypothetical protein
MKRGSPSLEFAQKYHHQHFGACLPPLVQTARKKALEDALAAALHEVHSPCNQGYHIIFLNM